MSEIKFGVHPRHVGSKYALQRICDLVDDVVKPEAATVETEPEGINASVDFLREVSCGYGYGNVVDVNVLESKLEQLKGYNNKPRKTLSYNDQNSMRNVCDIVETTVEPEAKKVLDQEYYGAAQAIPLRLGSQAVKCSIDAIEKISCDYQKRPDIRPEIDCLSHFTRYVRKLGINP